MNELMINAKKIQICLKKGFTLEETAQKYQTTEELLKTRIEQLYSAPTTAKNVLFMGLPLLIENPPAVFATYPSRLKQR